MISSSVVNLSPAPLRARARSRGARRFAAAVVLGLGWLPAAPGAAQSQPHMAGGVEIDPRAGRLVANLCLSGLMPGELGVSFLLNQGMTITRVHDGKRELRFVSDPADDVAHRHTIAASDPQGDEDGEWVGDIVCVEYEGSFPVHDVLAGIYAEEDASHVIAFNGNSLRARGVSRWHPAPYSPATGLVSEITTFRLEVECVTCSWLYVNGGPTISGPSHTFVSTEPREALLFAGDFPVVAGGSTLVAGEAARPDSIALFVGILDEIASFYGEYLGVAFGPTPDVLRITPVRRQQRGQLWGFYSDPAIALAGMSIPEFVSVIRGPDQPARRPVLGFLAHEMAHRYFGWRIGTASTYRDFFGEPFATFLELKAVRHFYGEVAYREGLASLKRSLLNSPPLVPLLEAKPEDLGKSAYRYVYGPSLLFSLEREIGEDRMRALLHALLVAPPAERDMAGPDLLRRSALAAGVPSSVWRRWETRCLRPPLERNECLRNRD
jgi:hypothetical protein